MMYHSGCEFILALLLCAVIQVHSQERQVPPGPLPPPVQPMQPVRPQGVQPGGTRYAVRCYICTWSVLQCTDFNCYNNPDTCTNNNFSPSLVQHAECPGGCEQFVVTDPNGLVQQWRRNCAPGNVPAVGFSCRTEYQMGFRIDRCICNRDWCNGASQLSINILINLSLIIIAFLTYTFC